MPCPPLSTCAQILEAHKDLWSKAVHHRFLLECKGETIQDNEFNTWLTQDRLFAIGFLEFIKILATQAPSQHLDTINSGVLAMVDEIEWFKEQGVCVCLAVGWWSFKQCIFVLNHACLNTTAAAAIRDLGTDVEPFGATSAYLKMLADINTKPYVEQAVTFWAVEAVYNEAWQIPKSSNKFKVFSERWGNSAFTDYCRVLEEQADEVLGSASDHDKEAACTIVKNIALMEVEFWDMAYTSS